MIRTLLRSSGGLRRARGALPSPARLSTAAANAASKEAAASAASPADEIDASVLAGKETRASIHSAFAARAMAAVKYDYFAQRAELECELDAAAAFKGLHAAATQQAMGYLELMEDYGERDFGLTLDNLEEAAREERADADGRYPHLATVAADEGLEQVDSWFQDMAEAAGRAAERLEVAAAMVEADGFEEEEDDDEGGAGEKSL